MGDGVIRTPGPPVPDVLVWGPAAEGGKSSQGRVLPAGWVWTCQCGASGTGYISEEAADDAALAHRCGTP